MSALFFLPWVANPEPVQLGSMHLVPYKRGQVPGTIHGISQETIDAILGNYGDPDFFPSSGTSKHVMGATIITWDDDVVGLDLSEDRIVSRLEQANYVAFAALARRRFCNNSGYCNADGYQVIAQGFTAEKPGATSIPTRRRDGRGLHYVGSASVPRFIRPHHVESGLTLAVDEALVCALLALPSGDLKGRIDEAIEVFLRANTDSPAMSERAEMVFMRVAFETLLDATHETSDLRKRFTMHFSEEFPAPPKWSDGVFTQARWRQRWPKNVNRPLDAWVQDFCNARNSAAHGPCGAKAPSLWKRHNHLLFSSWLFPLMVKKALEDKGLYQLNDEDKAARQGAEAFLAHDLLSYASEEHKEFWWDRVERDILFSFF